MDVLSALALDCSQNNGLGASWYKSASVDFLKVKEIAFCCIVIPHLILVNRVGSAVLQSVGDSCSCSMYTDYACALQRDILLQGRLYLSENWLCFHSNIFRWETTVRSLSSFEFHLFLVLPYQVIGLDSLWSHPVNLILVTLGCEKKACIPKWKFKSIM